eukprot:TRINITY_DN3837_c1_g1_i1.p1 TRINITY_DN3837_c1_g1~~TRINITY_DN3837_c1_g1_i1.p1  ORF type:complete len:186 (-),score=79.66 TRINITY_DN3837_c1_g1_i1:129-686(-)
MAEIFKPNNCRKCVFNETVINQGDINTNSIDLFLIRVPKQFEVKNLNKINWQNLLNDNLKTLNFTSVDENESEFEIVNLPQEEHLDIINLLPKKNQLYLGKPFKNFFSIKRVINENKPPQLTFNSRVPKKRQNLKTNYLPIGALTEQELKEYQQRQNKKLTQQQKEQKQQKLKQNKIIKKKNNSN